MQEQLEKTNSRPQAIECSSSPNLRDTATKDHPWIHPTRPLLSNLFPIKDKLGMIPNKPKIIFFPKSNNLSHNFSNKANHNRNLNSPVCLTYRKNINMIHNTIRCKNLNNSMHGKNYRQRVAMRNGNILKSTHTLPHSSLSCFSSLSSYDLFFIFTVHC